MLVVAAAVAIVLTPILVAARPVPTSALSAVELAQRVRASGAVAWSGDVATTATLQLPASASFAGLGQLLGENSQLRVWWGDPEHWRVDRIRGTGEADLVRSGQSSTRWVFESETATITPVSTIRFPDASDLLPATLARSVLQGARDSELSALSGRRVAGVDAAGLRLTPAPDSSTLSHVDVWVDPGSGLPLEVALYGADQRPVLTTALQDLTLGTPAARTITFDPPASVQVDYEQSVDAAARANAYAPDDLPPTLAGLTTRDGSDPEAVGIYGRGPATVIVVPLRGRVAIPLREQLRASAAAQLTSAGVLAPVGPVNLMLTGNPFDGSGFLLAGTVTAATMQRAAAQLADLT